jgi:hypothetical protein
VPILFLAFDGVMKLAPPAPVTQAFVRLGYPTSDSLGIGLALLLCTALYVVPRTAVLGALLLTGYLGGATATVLRVGTSPFEVLFPSIVAAFVWGGLWLRDSRVRAILPLRG